EEEDVRADVYERRAQRVGYRRMAAKGTRAVLGGRHRRRPDQQPPALRVHSRHPRRRQDDEEPQPGARGPRARGARHGEDLRGQRKILRAAPRARRQAGEGRQVAGPDQEGSAHARVRELGRAGAVPDQRRGGLQGRERGLSARSYQMRRPVAGSKTCACPASGERESLSPGRRFARPCVTSVRETSATRTTSSVCAPIGSTTTTSAAMPPLPWPANPMCSGRMPYFTGWPSVPPDDSTGQLCPSAFTQEEPPLFAKAPSR